MESSHQENLRAFYQRFTLQMDNIALQQCGCLAAQARKFAACTFADIPVSQGDFKGIFNYYGNADGADIRQGNTAIIVNISGQQFGVTGFAYQRYTSSADIHDGNRALGMSSGRTNRNDAPEWVAGKRGQAEIFASLNAQQSSGQRQVKRRTISQYRIFDPVRRELDFHLMVRADKDNFLAVQDALIACCYGTNVQP